MSRTAKKEKHQYGQGSIWFDTRHQKWYARVRAGKTVSGKANYITVCADTQSKCKKRLDEAKKKKAFFYFIDPETVTVGEMIEGIANQKYESKKIEKSTRDSELKNIHNYDFLVDMRVKDVTEEDMQLFFESKLDRSNSVLQNHYHYLEKVFNIALALNIIEDSPLRKLPKPCTRNTPVEIRPLTVDEQRDLTRLLLKHRDEYKYWNIFLISLYTGMSLGEITALNANDVDLENGYVRVTKKIVNANGKANLSYELKPKQKRNVPINIIIRPVFVMLLKEHKRVPGSPLFRNRNRHYISSTSVGSSFSKFVREFDICDPTLHGKVSFISLKKTFAARCLEANVQSKVVQKQLSISNNQTMRLGYPETTISARSEAAESTNDYLRSVGIG